MTKTKKHSEEENLARAAFLLCQLSGVLVCTLAACDGMKAMPEAVIGALYAATQLAHDANAIMQRAKPD